MTAENAEEMRLRHQLQILKKFKGDMKDNYKYLKKKSTKGGGCIHLMFNTGVKRAERPRTEGRTFRLAMGKTCECRACEDEKTAQQETAAVPLMQNIQKKIQSIVAER